MQWEIRGDQSGKVWSFHPTVDKVYANGERYRGHGEDGTSVLIHRCEKGGYWDDEVERMRLAIEIASRPEIRACPTIRQLSDVNEMFDDGSSTFGPAPFLTEIWEWADIALHELLDDAQDLLDVADGIGSEAVADAVAENVGVALDVLHGIGLVHCDVAPNNIQRVNKVWKLADLDSSVPRGKPTNRGPRNMRYLHPDREQSPDPIPLARDGFDTWALDRVIERILEPPAAR